MSTGVLLLDDLHKHSSSRAAIITTARAVSFGEISSASDALAKNLTDGDLVAISNLGSSHVSSHVIAYLACLKSNACAMMLTEERCSQQIIDAFNPDVTISADQLSDRRTGFNDRCLPSLLLSTSGSTGSKKFVKLTKRNIEANCVDIIKSLPILQSDIACLLLSPTYSYGLSIVNTHLSCGASIYVPNVTHVSRAFWKEASDAKVTSIGFVPSHLEVLAGQRFETLIPSSLRYITVAGGRVNAIGRQVLERFRAAGVEVYVMYGQTEATARLTCLPDRDFAHHVGSVGKQIGGHLYVEDTGEIVYSGENVFAGYAETRSDLSNADSIKTLRTGDVGRIDDGYLWITGRLKRIAKINSTRVSLDELEQHLEIASSVAVRCVSNDENIYAFSTGTINASDSPLRTRIKCHLIDEIPLLSNGKTDYNLLERSISD